MHFIRIAVVTDTYRYLDPDDAVGLSVSGNRRGQEGLVGDNYFYVVKRPYSRGANT